MLTRILAFVCLTVLLTGCATGRNAANRDQLQARITDLEKKLEEKDAEIVNLQYEVKDLSSKVDDSQSIPVIETPTPSYAATTSSSKHSGEIIRVNVDTASVQSALKNAGFYRGKIDGKIGPGTKAAIVDFQKSNGLNADGVVGRKTWDLLKAYSK